MTETKKINDLAILPNNVLLKCLDYAEPGPRRDAVIDELRSRGIDPLLVHVSDYDLEAGARYFAELARSLDNNYAIAGLHGIALEMDRRRGASDYDRLRELRPDEVEELAKRLARTHQSAVQVAYGGAALTAEEADIRWRRVFDEDERERWRAVARATRQI